MKEKLDRLFKECIQELEKIGIDINNKDIGKIEINISKRNNKRYGACKQEEPDIKSKYIEKIGRRKIVKYWKYNKHVIEISKWVMELDEEIIKNTIMHELIHCMPYCNNHGAEFKRYANYINNKLGYDISRVGNKEEDYKKSNLEYKEEKQFKYKIECQKCGYTFYRQRQNKNFTRKYRCGKCGGRFEVINLKEEKYGN